MPTTLAPVPQDWLDSFVSTLEPGKSSEEARKFLGFIPWPSWFPKNRIEKVIEEKVKVDQQVVAHSLRELTTLLKNENCVTKLGLDYNQGDVFLWIEVKNVQDEKISQKKFRSLIIDMRL